MNFFEHQDRARKKTGRLIILFIIAVLGVVLAVDAVVFAIVSQVTAEVRPEVLIYSTGLTLLAIFCGSIYKMMVLGGGGSSMARMLGGRPLVPNSGSADEQKVQNVVEEMAIASGVPVPQVYLLDSEPGINAFAAGWGQDDAVIGITRGAIKNLNRDELQGVVAHEFGHLFNGDTRLNLRLIGLLNGIMVISLIGYILLNALRYVRVSSGRGKDKGMGLVLAMLLLGAGLWLVGSIGVLFGRFIQAAVSRQREYLADASAVQFTRNPAGLASALKKIGGLGSHVHSPHAMETAHLFFSTSGKFTLAGLLATHPPLVQRIKAIDPSFDGSFEIGPGTTQILDETSNTRKGEVLASMLAGEVRRAVDPAQIPQQVGEISPTQLTFAAELIASIPPALARAAREPFSARAVLFALLLSDDPEVRQKQLQIIEPNVEPVCYQYTLDLIGSVASLHKGARLLMLDISVSALRAVSPQQAQRLRGIIRQMIEADGRITLFEYALQRVVEKQLAAIDMQPFEPVEFNTLKEVRPDAAIALSALASATGAQTQRAFLAGAKRLNASNPPDFVKVTGIGQLDAALKRLAQCAPPLKQRLIDAMAHTVAADGQINVMEAELLRATCATLNVPLPPMLGSN